MANEIIPQDLIIYRRILNDALGKITNEMYAQNIKCSYKYDFELVPTDNKPTPFLSTTKPLYLFRMFVVDKSRNPIGEILYLYNNYYPKDITESIHVVERRAIQDWFTNASKALYNYTHEQYMEEQKARQAFIDSRKAEGVTLENLQEEVQQNAKDELIQREQEIMKMMHPNIKG